MGVTNCSNEIQLVLGKKEWNVKPDKRMEAENPCIWMRTGVTKFKNCNNSFDCITCKYDKAMAKKGSWQDSMRLLGGMDRICRHTLTGQIDGRRCAYNYKCASCDFDQLFEDTYLNK